MEKKTKVAAENGKQELVITREFDLPVELVFQAFVEPELIEQWMGTRVLKMDTGKHGGWEFETKDTNGNTVFKANGVIHECIPNERITRTFEMENAPFDVQLEFLQFEKITEETSKLQMQVVYRSVELRDQMLKMPFEYGINMAHNRLEEVLKKLGVKQ
ncbi:MAG TPA: SRPBCC domain-containing protein [Flavitalea sp.]|nr:SRPBCC domain-containing protein [Flavitalea sp.]